MIGSRPKSPDKGSFPLDHDAECKKEVRTYLNCLTRRDNVPKHCREKQQAYIECRMAR